jgi:hypothetical protein
MRSAYGTLSRSSEDTIEFVVNGRVQRAWKTGGPTPNMSDLFQRCLLNLTGDGWRPISHQNGQGEAVILARVPYTAGSKLATYGTLRFADRSALVLSVSGSIMRRWSDATSAARVVDRALEELAEDGWRLHRRYDSGATVVRG